MDNIAREEELETALAEEGVTAVRFTSTGVNFEVDLTPGNPIRLSLPHRIEKRLSENVRAHLDRDLDILLVQYTDQN